MEILVAIIIVLLFLIIESILKRLGKYRLANTVSKSVYVIGFGIIIYGVLGLMI